ncbi:hypothetical protein Tco_0231818 [Tanacetum coccineum]
MRARGGGGVVVVVVGRVVRWGVGWGGGGEGGWGCAGVAVCVVVEGMVAGGVLGWAWVSEEAVGGGVGSVWCGVLEWWVRLRGGLEDLLFVRGDGGVDNGGCVGGCAGGVVCVVLVVELRWEMVVVSRSLVWGLVVVGDGESMVREGVGVRRGVLGLVFGVRGWGGVGVTCGVYVEWVVGGVGWSVVVGGVGRMVLVFVCGGWSVGCVWAWGCGGWVVEGVVECMWFAGLGVVRWKCVVGGGGGNGVGWCTGVAGVGVGWVVGGGVGYGWLWVSSGGWMMWGGGSGVGVGGGWGLGGRNSWWDGLAEVLDWVGGVGVAGVCGGRDGGVLFGVRCGVWGGWDGGVWGLWVFVGVFIGGGCGKGGCDAVWGGLYWLEWRGVLGRGGGVGEVVSGGCWEWGEWCGWGSGRVVRLGGGGWGGWRGGVRKVGSGGCWGVGRDVRCVGVAVLLGGLGGGGGECAGGGGEMGVVDGGVSGLSCGGVCLCGVAWDGGCVLVGVVCRGGWCIGGFVMLGEGLGGDRVLIVGAGVVQLSVGVG